MLPHFLAYFSPRYHPWNTDDSNLIEQWTAHNAQYIVNKPNAGGPQPAPAA
jgi:predicted metal-dependent hydrolase